MRRPRTVSWLIGLAALAACSGSTAPANGQFRVRLFNDSGFTLTDIHVSTGDAASVSLSNLAHGALSDETIVTEMHETPAVSLKADGESLSITPAEGFAGFNPTSAAGSYTIDIMVSGSPKQLSVRITQPLAN